MKEDLVERVLNIANHINETHDTIRKTAKIYGYSKSTIHNDVSIKLKTIDFALYQRTKKILYENFAEKHIRGGAATKQKYKNLENEKYYEEEKEQG